LSVICRAVLRILFLTPSAVDFKIYSQLLSICLEKSGVVKEEAFFTILKLHGVELGE